MNKKLMVISFHFMPVRRAYRHTLYLEKDRPVKSNRVFRHSIEMLRHVCLAEMQFLQFAVGYA